MSTFRAGRLRHRVSIQKQTEVIDPDLGPIGRDWVEMDKVWAEISPLSARDFIQSSALQSQITARITIRYRDDVDASMRVVHRNKVYNITGVLSDRDSGVEYLTLPCSEGTNEG